MEAAPKSHGEMLATISNGLVHLHTRYYGKGPTRAKTYMIDDTVLCMLEEGFTTVERTLIDEGRGDAVHDIRRSFQQAMESQFVEVVESATARKVIAYLSQVHVGPDVAVELFMLAPSPDSGKASGDGAIESPIAAIDDTKIEPPRPPE